MWNERVLDPPLIKPLSRRLSSWRSSIPNWLPSRREGSLLEQAGEAVASEGVDIVTYEILQKLSWPGAGTPRYQTLYAFGGTGPGTRGRQSVSHAYPDRQRSQKIGPLSYGVSSILSRRRVRRLGRLLKNLLPIPYTPDPDSLAYLMRVVASWLWMEGESAAKLSKNPTLPGIRYGAVAMLTDQLAWFMDALVELDGTRQRPASDVVPLQEQKEWSVLIHWSITRFERRLRYGLPEYLTSVAHLRVRGWHRQRLMELWENLGGWEHPVHSLHLQIDQSEEASTSSIH